MITRTLSDVNARTLGLHDMMSETTSLLMLVKISKRAKRETITRPYPRLSEFERSEDRGRDYGQMTMPRSIILVRFAFGL